MTTRYKGKDQIGAWYFPFVEESYGETPSYGNTTRRIGILQEIVPICDPEIKPIYALRSESNQAGLPFALLSRRKNVRCRLTWIQQTTPSQGPDTPYWQRHFLKDPGAQNYTNFFLEVKIKDFWLRFTGLKPNVITVRGSIGEPQLWTAECIGKTFSTATSQICQYTEAEDSDPPWMWQNTYIKYYDAEANDEYLLPDVTDYEFRFDKGLKPNFSFNTDGSLTLTSLEETEFKATARLTVNLTSKKFLDYLLNLTESNLKLFMPDGKYIYLMQGKFYAVEPTIKPEDLIAQRIEFVAKYYEHNF